MHPAFVKRIPESLAASMNIKSGKKPGASNAIYSRQNVGTQGSLGDYGARGMVAWPPRTQHGPGILAEELRRGPGAKPGTPSADTEKADQWSMEVLVDQKFLFFFNIYIDHF